MVLLTARWRGYRPREELLWREPDRCDELDRREDWEREDLERCWPLFSSSSSSELPNRDSLAPSSTPFVLDWAPSEVMSSTSCGSPSSLLVPTSSRFTASAKRI